MPWGKDLKTKVKGLREASIDSRERVERGGRVERDRKASEDAPIGYRTMNRLYLLISDVRGSAWKRSGRKTRLTSPR